MELFCVCAFLATSHVWLLSTENVAKMAKEMNYFILWFYLILFYFN